MPRAGYSVAVQDSPDQGGAEMGAAGAEGVEMVVNVDEEHLCAVEAVDFELLFLAGFELLQGCEPFELEFLGHGC
jgi:hypothetical protein